MHPSENTVSHQWETVSPTESLVTIAFDWSVDTAATTVEALRAAVFSALDARILPQIASDAPAASLPLPAPDGAAIEGLSVVDFDVMKGGGKWTKEVEGKNTVLSGNVTVRLESAAPIAPKDALDTARKSVAGEIARIIADSYQNLTRPQTEAMQKAA